MPHRAVGRVVRDIRDHHAPDVGDVLTFSLIVCVFFTFALAGYGLYSNLKSAEQTKQALCIFKYDLIDRRDRSAAFLEEHPGEKMILGIPRETIEQGVRNQTATIASLRILDCPQDHEGTTP